jgi:hypothetical protein
MLAAVPSAGEAPTAATFRLRLTRKGEARYRELSARFLALASTMGAEMSEADIRKTSEIVRRLSDEIKGRAQPRARDAAGMGLG